MTRGDQASDNIFVQLKKHIDARVFTGLSAILGFSGWSSRTAQQATSSVASPYSLNMGHSPPESGQTKESQQALALLSVTSDEAYHPLALRHLPQPKPFDCPTHYDASIFTFQDAFEDLLTVTQGRNLMPIDAKYVVRMLLNQMYPSGEPSFLWRRRLQRQGLVPERRVSHPPIRPEVEQSGDLSQLMSQLDRVASNVWETAREELDKEKPAFWNNVDTAMKSLFKTPSEALDKEGPAFWDNVNTAVRSLLGEDDPASSKKTEGPRHFDDLFSTVESEAANHDKSWDTFMKAIAEGSKKQETTANGELDKVTETDEYVDRFGWRHQKKTTRTLDSEGKEIGKETRWTVTSADHKPMEAVMTLPGRNEETSNLSDHRRFSEPETAADGTRDVETREGYVDWFGYSHTTTKVKTLDKEGNEISSSTHITIRPAGTGEWVPSDGSREAAGQEKIGDGVKIYSDHGKVKKTGWFWK